MNMGGLSCSFFYFLFCDLSSKTIVMLLVLFKIWLAMPLDLGRLLFKTVPALTVIVFTVKFFSSAALKSFLALFMADFRSFAIGLADFLVKKSSWTMASFTFLPLIKPAPILA